MTGTPTELARRFMSFRFSNPIPTTPETENTHMSLRIGIVSLPLLLTSPLVPLAPPAVEPAAAAPAACDDWNAPGYFITATPEAVTACIEEGADPNAPDAWGFTPLHNAAWTTSDPAVVAALAEGGADPDAKLEDGSTPLHVAAAGSSYPAVVAALVKAGASVRARDGAGYQPLWGAVLCNQGNPEVIEALLDAGADAGARDRHDVSPWDIVRSTPELRDSNAYARMQARHERRGQDWELDAGTLRQYRAACEAAR